MSTLSSTTLLAGSHAPVRTRSRRRLASLTRPRSRRARRALLIARGLAVLSVLTVFAIASEGCVRSGVNPADAVATRWEAIPTPAPSVSDVYHDADQAG